MGAKFTSLVSWKFEHYDEVHDWSPNAMLAARMRAFEALHSQRRRRRIGTVHQTDEDMEALSHSNSRERLRTGEPTGVNSNEAPSSDSIPRAGILSLEDSAASSSKWRRKRLVAATRFEAHFYALLDTLARNTPALPLKRPFLCRLVTIIAQFDVWDRCQRQAAAQSQT